MQPNPPPAQPWPQAATTPFLTIACLLILTLLGGCAGLQRTAPGANLVHQARTLEKAGHYRQAAQAYEGLARSASTPQREDFLLRAAHAWSAAGQPAKARTVLASVHVPPGAARLDARRRLVLGEIDLAERRPLQALSDSVIAHAEQLPPGIQRHLYRLRAAAYLQAGNPLESARARIALGRLLREPQAIHDNQERIWRALGRLTTPALERLRSAAQPGALRGWLALAELARATPGNPRAVGRGIAGWERQYPDHPATRVLVPQLLQYFAAARGYPRRIALLLPLRGPYARASKAVLDGFLAAYYAHTGQSAPVEIRVYDTGDQPADAVQSYRRAIRDGAGFIVGPLRKGAVAALAHQPPGPVPVLALNYLGTDATGVPSNLYQFGLSPEQEARQAAERAWLDGRSRALVLVPAGPWGERVARAFERRWQQLGGATLAEQRYDPTRTDFANPIRRLLNLDRSRARYRALRSLLHRKLQFEPRRRKDADFVFLAAFPREARLLRPQLRFHHAAGLPVYATSHVYAGTPDPSRDRDLDGIRFCDMPWILAPGPAQQALRSELERLWPDQARHLPRLEALGVDAYRLIPQLPALRKSPFARFEGATGSLSLDAAGQIHRDLPWAQFRNGLPRLLDQVSIPASAPGPTVTPAPITSATPPVPTTTSP
jgi:outer membrane PBP1 activator LpoA protein